MQSRQKAILCLCHDDTTLRVRQMLLEHVGYRVLATRSLSSLRHMVAEDCPDMLLMDNNYPGVDCEEVAEHIKSVCPSMLAVVLSPYFATRESSHGAIDRFVVGDDTPANVIAEIQSIFEGQDSQPGKTTNTAR